MQGGSYRSRGVPKDAGGVPMGLGWSLQVRGGPDGCKSEAKRS